ncbi:MAG: Uncharacterised protein [Methanobacteriota archaeon]|nr:MAG: Uncharacterised protein [Euryarchaeota archaeon]
MSVAYTPIVHAPGSYIGSALVQVPSSLALNGGIASSSLLTPSRGIKVMYIVTLLGYSSMIVPFNLANSLNPTCVSSTNNSGNKSIDSISFSSSVF